MPKFVDDSKIVRMNQYNHLRSSACDPSIEWTSIPEIDLMVSMLSSEDAEGLAEFMALEEGEKVTLELEITDTRLAQAVMHSIRSRESFVPGMKINTIKLNPEEE